MHAGRIGHPVLLPDGLVPVSASPVKAEGQVYTHVGPKDFVEPHELTDAEVRATVADFVTAARNAVAAGFDGVELHGANGYLIHQFLAPNTNRRTDAWGGSDEARTRFAVEVVKAVAAEIGPERTGLRISPGNPYNDIDEPAPEATYTALVRAIEPLGLAYLHILEATPIRELTLALRKAFSGTVVINVHSEGPTGPNDHTVIDDGIADLISYGALFLANPDLPARLKAGGPFNTPDPSTFFGGDARGYTDYPALDAV